MDQYIYLLLGIFFSLIWGMIYYYRKDLRRRILKASLIGGFSGFIAEHWYLKDYWQPPTVLGNAIVSIEDFIAGFFIIGISTSIYNFVFNKEEIKTEKPQKLLFLMLFIIGVVFMVVLPSYGFNSMLISPITFLLFTVLIIFLRPDLMKKAVYSGILFLIIALPIYTVLFEWIAPHFWNKYWLLSNTKFAVHAYGNIPLIEAFWYFSWGSFGGVCYSFYSGSKCVSLQRVVNT